MVVVKKKRRRRTSQILPWTSYRTRSGGLKGTQDGRVITDDLYPVGSKLRDTSSDLQFTRSILLKNFGDTLSFLPSKEWMGRRSLRICLLVSVLKVEESDFDITYEHASVFYYELRVVDVRRLVFEDEESTVGEL